MVGSIYSPNWQYIYCLYTRYIFPLFGGYIIPTTYCQHQNSPMTMPWNSGSQIVQLESRLANHGALGPVNEMWCQYIHIHTQLYRNIYTYGIYIYICIFVYIYICVQKLYTQISTYTYRYRLYINRVFSYIYIYIHTEKHISI